jgi:hypothetical protein
LFYECGKGQIHVPFSRNGAFDEQGCTGQYGMVAMMHSLAAESGRNSWNARTIDWRGRSGRFYTLEVESISGFSMSDYTLYLLLDAAGTAWTGSLADIMNDTASRARFRAALSRATAIYSLPVEDALEALTVAWDLEGGERAISLSAA